MSIPLPLLVYLLIGTLAGLAVFCLGMLGAFKQPNQQQNRMAQHWSMHTLKWLFAACATIAAWPIVAWWVAEGEINRRKAG